MNTKTEKAIKVVKEYLTLKSYECYDEPKFLEALSHLISVVEKWESISDELPEKYTINEVYDNLKNAALNFNELHDIASPIIKKLKMENEILRSMLFNTAGYETGIKNLNQEIIELKTQLSAKPREVSVEKITAILEDLGEYSRDIYFGNMVNRIKNANKIAQVIHDLIYRKGEK